MVIRTFFDKNNTILNNQFTNTGLNPITQLYYGGALGEERYTRYIFHFDETRLKSLYSGGTFTDLSKLKHTLKMVNTGAFDTRLLNGMMADKDRASSFDLIVFKVNQDWDNGVGYDYEVPTTLIGDTAYSTGPSNWVEAKTGVFWDNGPGVYSGDPTSIIVGTQHFDKGNENINIDITDYVNSIITGETNYGLGVAFDRSYELMNTSTLQYVGFFTRNTQTFYEPYVETIYSNQIKDDRDNFFLDKNNKLYLYVNVNGNPTNLDTLPTVEVFDNEGNLFSAYTNNDVKHITLGVYSIEILVETTSNNVETMYNDVWSNISINGVTRPNISLDFVVKDSFGYYSIGNNSSLPKKVALNLSGIKNKEKIKRGDIRKILVSSRIPYTVEQNQILTDLKYRIYVTEGRTQLTVIDWQPIEMANNNHYFLLDTESLIPNTYYIDLQSISNLEITTLTNVCEFEIISQVELK